MQNSPFFFQKKKSSFYNFKEIFIQFWRLFAYAIGGLKTLQKKLYKWGPRP